MVKTTKQKRTTPQDAFDDRSLADGLESIVRTRIERSPVGDLELAVVEANIPLHDGFLCVIETDRRSILEGVVDELGTIGVHELDAFDTPDNMVVVKFVVLGSS